MCVNSQIKIFTAFFPYPFLSFFSQFLLHFHEVFHGIKDLMVQTIVFVYGNGDVMSSLINVSISLAFPFLNVPINPNFFIKLYDKNFLIQCNHNKHTVVVYGLQGFLKGTETTPIKIIKKMTQIVIELKIEVSRIKKVFKKILNLMFRIENKILL